MSRYIRTTGPRALALVVLVSSAALSLGAASRHTTTGQDRTSTSGKKSAKAERKAEKKASGPVTSAVRVSLLRRGRVWNPTNISAMDIRTGPAGKGALTPNQLVTCDYIEKKNASGRSPKFDCVIARGDEVKVKYGRDNGEVYGEVAATRLLWALGFGADRMYPVRVVCRGCPSTLGGRPYGSLKERFFDVAAIERKAAGREIEGRDMAGWSWPELDFLTENDGGAPKAQRDALKLVAAMIQHTDTKPSQQRLVCLGEKKGSPAGCDQPFLMINDLGLTFGRANTFNDNTLGSVNFERWSQTRVWKEADGCVAKLEKSSTGTLEDPVISDEGRAFLTGLLMQLTDRQLHDLFSVARFDMRTFPPSTTDPQAAPTAPATIEQWVAAFKDKRDQIATRRCSAVKAS